MANTRTSEISYYTIGFYNLENLFDTENDPNILDDDFTEDSERNWNENIKAILLELLLKKVSGWS